MGFNAVEQAESWAMAHPAKDVGRADRGTHGVPHSCSGSAISIDRPAPRKPAASKAASNHPTLSQLHRV